MQTIHKYPFTIKDNFTMSIPADALIVHVEKQNETPCMWILLDPDKPYVTRNFSIKGTGHPIESNLMHVKTFQDGAFVWHVFERFEI